MRLKFQFLGGRRPEFYQKSKSHYLFQTPYDSSLYLHERPFEDVTDSPKMISVKTR